MNNKTLNKETKCPLVWCNYKIFPNPSVDNNLKISKLYKNIEESFLM
jgi:hypothetical protein